MAEEAEKMTAMMAALVFFFCQFLPFSALARDELVAFPVHHPGFADMRHNLRLASSFGNSLVVTAAAKTSYPQTRLMLRHQHANAIRMNHEGVNEVATR